MCISKIELSENHRIESVLRPNPIIKNCSLKTKKVKMKTIPFAAIVILIVLCSCEKQNLEIRSDLTPQDICENCVQFDQLEVGQVSYYEQIKGEPYYQSDDPAIKYLPDTLSLKVIKKEGNIFTLEETLKSKPQERFSYNIELSSEGISFFKDNTGTTSNIFPLHKLETIKLTEDMSTFPQAKMKGWYIENNCERQPCYFQIEQFSGLEKLMVFLDYSPMAYDGNGFYAIYNQSMFVRMVSVGAWTAEGNGWELIF